MDQPTFTVSELGELLRRTVEQVFPDDVWVTGEIRDLARPRSGHVYFSLVDTADDPGATADARISVTLFTSTKAVVNKILKRAGGVRMEDGIRVRIRAAIDFYPARGQLFLRMTGIDPAYTLGQLAAGRERLLRELRTADLLDANARLPLPLLPLRIGLVTSRGSAAAADFLHELERSRFAWQVTLADTPVQGPTAPAAVARSIAALAARSVDIVAVVRGGGSRTELAAFDAEVVALSIARCRTPVVTGIGHEIDVSIADEVAHTAHKTPTACAAFLVEAATRATDRCDHAWVAIAELARTAPQRAGERLRALSLSTAQASRHRIESAAVGLDHTVKRVERATVTSLDTAEATLERASETLSRRSLAVLDHAETRLDGHGRQLDLLDPARLLARGWTITQTVDGDLVRSASDVGPDDVLVSRTARGTITSTVTETHP